MILLLKTIKNEKTYHINPSFFSIHFRLFSKDNNRIMHD